MEREKVLMTSFFAANAVDLAVSAYGWSLGLSEQWPALVSKHFLEAGEPHHAILVKTAATALVIGAYALTKTQPNRLEFPVEKTVQAVNFIVWGATIWNAVQVAQRLSALGG